MATNTNLQIPWKQRFCLFCSLHSLEETWATVKILSISLSTNPWWDILPNMFTPQGLDWQARTWLGEFGELVLASPIQGGSTGTEAPIRQYFKVSRKPEVDSSPLKMLQGIVKHLDSVGTGVAMEWNLIWCPCHRWSWRSQYSSLGQTLLWCAGWHPV